MFIYKGATTLHDDICDLIWENVNILVYFVRISKNADLKY